MKRKQETNVKPRKDVIDALKKQKNASKPFKLSNIFGYKFWIGSTVIAILGIALYGLLNPPTSPSDVYVNDEDLIKEINEVSKTYQAAPSERFRGWKVAEVKETSGHTYQSSSMDKIPQCTSWEQEHPETFDARTHWESCYADATVMNQMNCSGSWAIAPAMAMSMRTCISKLLPSYAQLSSQQLISCIDESMNCNRGLVDVPYKYLEMTGLLSEECFPFTGTNSVCQPTCSEGFSIIGADACFVQTEEAIMSQIYSNGPVVANLLVYNDFLVYSSGVYEPIPSAVALMHKKPRSYMSQAVQIIGWGTENDTPYWLIENSWGPEWGDGGYAKIARRLYPGLQALANTPKPYTPPTEEESEEGGSRYDQFKVETDDEDTPELDLDASPHVDVEDPADIEIDDEETG